MRVPPGSRKDIGTLNWLIATTAGRVAKTQPPNLFLVLGRHKRLFRGWLRFAGRLMPGGRLPRRETELVILRVAHVRDCAYEFTHHVRLGARVGLSNVDVDRVTQGPSAWPAREQAILTAVDKLLHDRDLDDDTWHTLRAHLDDRDVIELCLLVGHYDMLATTIATLRIPLEREPHM